jgi:hypothetical protein
MLRRNREIVIFNLSAIDLFCSGMGAVMVLMVLLMPYYRKQAPVTPPKPEVVVAPPPAPAPVVVVTPPPVPVSPQPVPEPGIQVRGIDVMFVMDATMSMNEELTSVRTCMVSIVQVLRRLSDEVRVGFVAYIDRAVPWYIPLLDVGRTPAGDANLKRLLTGINQVELVGNITYPEDVCGGLAKTVSTSWPASSENRRQMIILIGDARTHEEDTQRSFQIVKTWISAGKSRSLHAVYTATPSLEWPGEFEASGAYFKEVARIGNGQYHEDQGDLLGSILDIIIVR